MNNEVITSLSESKCAYLGPFHDIMNSVKILLHIKFNLMNSDFVQLKSGSNNLTIKRTYTY